MQDQLPSYFSQEGEKGIHRRGLRYHLNKKGKEGDGISTNPLSTTPIPASTVRENTVDAYLRAVRAAITQQGAKGAPGSYRVMPD